MTPRWPLLRRVMIAGWPGAIAASVDKTVRSRTGLVRMIIIRIPMFAMIDVNEALEKLRAVAASPGADAGQCLQNAFFLMQMLPIDGSHRWDSLRMNNCGLWIPDNQYYADAGSSAW